MTSLRASPIPDASPERTRAWTRQDLQEGVLNAEQHLEWTGTWPTSPDDLGALAVEMERQHLLSVERFSLRLLHGRREGQRLACRLPTGAVALGFTDASTTITPQRIVRRWSIDPSFFARRLLAAQGSAATYGDLEIGLELLDNLPPDTARPRGDGISPNGPARIHGWVAVTAFPSRFLTPVPGRLRRLAFFWKPVGQIYAFFHAQASFSCLRGVARAMHSPDR